MVGGVDGQGMQLGQQLTASCRRERGGHPDVMQHAGVVVQAEQQRADPVAACVDPVARHHAVGRPFVLDLDQGPSPRFVAPVDRLGDDAVESGTLELGEPTSRHLGVGGGGGDAHPLHRSESVEQLPTPLGDRSVEQGDIAEGEQIEGDAHGRCPLGEHPHPRVGRMDPLGQCVEVEAGTVGPGYDDLAVDHRSAGEGVEEWLAQFGEVPVERFAGAARDDELVAVAEDDAPEAVPLRLVHPTPGGLDRDRAGQPGEHRVEGRGDG